MLWDRKEPAKWQAEDMSLGEKMRDLTNRDAGGRIRYWCDGLFSYAPSGIPLCFATPRSLIAGVLTIVHTTHGHPRIAMPTALGTAKLLWPSMKQDVRGYVLSCGCRRRKRSTIRRIVMLPVRFIWPCGVLDMVIHDVGRWSEAGSKYLLVVVDKAAKLVFVYPLSTQTPKGCTQVARYDDDLRRASLNTEQRRDGFLCRGSVTFMQMVEFNV